MLDVSLNMQLLPIKPDIYIYSIKCIHSPKTTFITKPKAKSGNYQRERPMLHMLKLKSPENAR